MSERRSLCVCDCLARLQSLHRAFLRTPAAVAAAADDDSYLSPAAFVGLVRVKRGSERAVRQRVRCACGHAERVAENTC